jgi:sphingomyelin phosphodiesterase
MFDAVLQETSTLDFDFIVWTGDNPPHDVWEETAPQQLARIERVTAKIAQYFPKIPVYPAIGTSSEIVTYYLGNHDTFPVDQYNRLPVDAYHHDDFQWLSDGLVKAWGPWLDSNATATLAAGGYYTMLVKPG